MPKVRVDYSDHWTIVATPPKNVQYLQNIRLPEGWYATAAIIRSLELLEQSSVVIPFNDQHSTTMGVKQKRYGVSLGLSRG